MLSRFKTPLICVAIPLLEGGLSALLTKNTMANFEMLNQPALTPPPELFPVVWTILFILMGIASYLVYESDANANMINSALRLYAIQLIMNFCWSIVFFNLGWYLFAFVWLILLWLVILVTTWMFYKISKPAAYMMVPYVLWVTFAAYLNFMIWRLN